MITLRGLTKRFGAATAVDNLTLDLAPGQVTGFLGPSGVGKSTTMRMILGLDRPTTGQALIDGRRYAALRHPLRETGALLDAKAAHPGRSARKHLLAMARSNGLPPSGRGARHRGPVPAASRSARWSADVGSAGVAGPARRTAR